MGWITAAPRSSATHSSHGAGKAFGQQQGGTPGCAGGDVLGAEQRKGTAFHLSVQPDFPLEPSRHKELPLCLPQGSCTAAPAQPLLGTRGLCLLTPHPLLEVPPPQLQEQCDSDS